MTDPDKRIDDDWKKRAQDEKAKIARELEGAADPANDDAKAPPVEADPLFPSLVQQIAYPALMALGQIPDPRSGERMLDLKLAKESINLLSVLEKKTAGNRNPEEDKMIRDLVRDLQMAYTQTAEAAQRSVTDQASGNPAE
ncbi:MAG: DUF1844 domain-containing protein [Planctomycetota bacterium]|nr:DUF1844 domain-containing protein [Planctomycetota bacterium]